MTFGFAVAGVVELLLYRSRLKSSLRFPHTTARFAPSLATATASGLGSGPYAATGPSVLGPTSGGFTGSQATRARTPTRPMTNKRREHRTM